VVEVVRKKANKIFTDARRSSSRFFFAMRILISGSSGLVGSALCDFFKKANHEIVPLFRHSHPGGIHWNPKKGKMNKEDFEGFDAIIHLAGKSVTSGWWTDKLKEEIFQSRCRDTWLLSQLLTRLDHPPQTLIVASAAGYYGNRGDELLTESSKAGKGFLADVCEKWEEATSSIEKQGIRTVHTRFGIIFSPKGGSLKKLLLPFRLGLGAIMGSGNQYISWIALEDVVHAIQYILDHGEISGPVNVVSPFPETMRSFAQKLAKALHRPLFLKIGEKPLKWLLGEMAEETVLSSIQAVPEKLQSRGYHFLFPRLEEYFEAILRSS